MEEYKEYINSINNSINQDILLNIGYISKKSKSLSKEIINTLASDLNNIIISMNNMTLPHVEEIYKNLLVEFSGIDTRVPEVFTIENKIKTCNINIPGILECKFDIEKPIFMNDYKIATIYKLTYRGENILSKKPIQLYKSKGTSGDSTLNIWLPFSGRESKIASLKKPEDNLYIRRILLLQESMSPYASPTFKIEFFNDLLPHFKHLLKYKRFMDKDYAISSYLLSLYEYEPLEKTEEEKALEVTESNDAFNKYVQGSWIKPSNHKFYYKKYLKYKQKYMQLKSSMN
jgi:hypothetical protein